jgi:iron complex outermembrane recepter protein
MSNSMNTLPTIRWKLLSTVSAAALIASACMAQASGNDADRPLIWIELGGQAENIAGQGEVFAPAFLAAYPNSSVLWNGVTPLQAQKPPKFSFGEEGKISFQPKDSDWVFAAAVRVGRSSNFRHVDHQTSGTYAKYLNGVPGNLYTAADFADTQVHHRESHAILDFSVGKDVGLGIFGHDGSSILSVGVRFAQFTSKSTFDIRARPDLSVTYKYFSYYYNSFKIPHPKFHTYHATGQALRSFRGVGPSLSWNGSAPFAGNPQDGEVTFDWGANAALLFGKQRARVQHQESAHFKSGIGVNYASVYQHPPRGHINARSVSVPDIGVFAGLSYRYDDARISLGYRADFFFGAVDGGIDTHKSTTLGFNGPYASISVGIGD